MQDEHEDADIVAQAATARPGGQAKGGVAAQAGDTASPEQAASAGKKAKAEMRQAGFGDDKGGDIS